MKTVPILMGTLLMLGTAIGSPSSPLLQTQLLKQSTNTGPVLPMSADETAQLGDPLFVLALRDHADVTDLGQLENLLQPDASKRQVFVVSEEITDPTPGPNHARRAVIAFTGKNGNTILDSNVMLAVFFNDQTCPTPAVIEAWGWDGTRGRYNYYRLDDAAAPNGKMSWKFRMSSDGADMLTPQSRQGTCMACHVNGGPVMKELLLPWNNWHSFASQVPYLTPTGDPATRWAVATKDPLSGHLTGAESLESNIAGGIKQYATQRMLQCVGRQAADGRLALDANGFGQVVSGRRLLRSLFLTTEYNVISSGQKSGLHPFSAGAQTGPTQSVMIPATFFLNANLIAGGGSLQYKGLGLAASQQFATLPPLTPAEYKQLVNDAGVKIAGQPGDTNFAWIIPEASHIDNALADRLLQTGVVTPEFLAAIQTVDLETPVFSTDRAALLRFVPDNFRFQKVVGDPLQTGRHPDDLTKQVIAALQASQPTDGSVEARFLNLLQDPDPKKRLADAVNAYLAREQKLLGDPQTRPSELKRLYQKAVAARLKALSDPILRTLNESGTELFPVP